MFGVYLPSYSFDIDLHGNGVFSAWIWRRSSPAPLAAYVSLTATSPKLTFNDSSIKGLHFRDPERPSVRGSSVAWTLRTFTHYGPRQLSTSCSSVQQVLPVIADSMTRRISDSAPEHPSALRLQHSST